MLTNRRSMMAPPNRMPSWHPQSKPYPDASTAPLRSSPPPDIPSCLTPALLTSTTPTLPGHRIIRVLGTCHGTTTCARKDSKSFIKNIANSFSGGWREAKSLTAVLYQARDQAIGRLVKEAVALGANAVVGLSVREGEVLGCVVVSVCGTGVWVEKEREGMGTGKRDSAQEGEDPFC
jgi:uncharacterized protein YbjQ (UPF0145 family)